MLVLFHATQQPELSFSSTLEIFLCIRYSEQLGAIREFADPVPRQSCGKTGERSLIFVISLVGVAVSPLTSTSLSLVLEG